MASVNLTENNLKLLKAVVTVMKGTIDWEEVKDIAGMSTSKYARDQWAIVRTKLLGAGNEGGATTAADKGSNGAATTTTTPKKKDATPKKRKAADEGDDTETANLNKKPKKAVTPKPKNTALKPVDTTPKPTEATPVAEEDTDGVKREEVEAPNEAGRLMDEMLGIDRAYF
ncbi:uncharacterized protein LTR77_009017 [Saxophila tyrrhenica]|uniref:Uncharacterized protein n=1 Tax=Saxophila tyrrhenica TaxID=1690608 RepID=A0AAV9NZF1_9PEZI|nr:hypothetical protein LTR77_009017 [Saxophila tyrrhenica]